MIIAGLFIALVLNISLKPNIKDFLQLHKCPACYGVSLCNDILQGPAEVILILKIKNIVRKSSGLCTM